MNSKKKAVNSTNLTQDFINNPILYRFAQTLLNHVYTNAVEIPVQWFTLFQLNANQLRQKENKDKRQVVLNKIFNIESHTTFTEEQMLFALHSAYAFFLKKLVCHILQVQRIQQVQTQFDNLVNDDWFTWVDHLSNDEVAQHASEIKNALQHYDVKLNQQDFFQDYLKDFYEMYIPSQIRHALGEYYTPSYLVDHVIDKTLSLHEQRKNGCISAWRALDPTCGSGAFLVGLMNKIKVELLNGEVLELLPQLLNRVAGIDINPLAILTARVNFFINISPLLVQEQQSGQRICIPIYLGDATYLPRWQNDGKHIDFRITINHIVDAPHKSKMVRMTVEDVNNLLAGGTSLCEARLTKWCAKNDVSLLNDKVARQQLLEQLQYHAVSQIHKFDVIVGNPAWVAWRNLPQAYRERIQSLPNIKNIFSGDARTGGINLNLSALICQTAATNWLANRESSVLGFLMPDVLLSQKTYAGFRRLQLPNGEHNDVIDRPSLARFLSFDVWQGKKNQHFLNVGQKFNTYYIGIEEQRAAQATYENVVVPVEIIDVVDGQLQKSNAVAHCVLGINNPNNHFIVSKTMNEANDVGLMSIFPNPYKGRQGIATVPMTLWLYDFVATETSNDNTNQLMFKLKSKNFKRTMFSMPEQTLTIESYFVYPLLQTTDLQPFHHNKPQHAFIFPYDETYSKRLPLPFEQLEVRTPHMAQHLLNLKDMIVEQQINNEYRNKLIKGSNNNEPLFYAFERVGDYTFAPYSVAYRDNTKQVACVLQAINYNGVHRRPLVKEHVCIISQRPDGSYISLDEAHYICGILNCDAVCQYVENNFDARSYPINPLYAIPLFGIPERPECLEQQMQIVELAKQGEQMWDNPEIIKQIKTTISEIYLDMLAKLKTNTSYQQ